MRRGWRDRPGPGAGRFTHELLIEIERDCVRTVLQNRPGWPVVQADIATLDGTSWQGINLVSGGVPCTPHSRGGKQLGADDDRHLWSQVMRIVSKARPRAVMLETSDGILSAKFDTERSLPKALLHGQGYKLIYWASVGASRYGVPQRRNRAVLIAFRDTPRLFRWPERTDPPPTVGECLRDLVAARGWPGADAWAAGAQHPAPTVSIGSHLHGGADLGPSQTKAAWAKMGVDGSGIADEAPGPDGKYRRGRNLIFDAGERGLMLTIPMVARLQGFPDNWQFTGGKTSLGRQIGNAFPPPVAKALGIAIREALEAAL